MQDVEDIIGEIVCIYKKIRQGREYRTYQFKSTNIESQNIDGCFNFNRHTLSSKKYLLFSEDEGVLESDRITLPTNTEKFFWLNIFDPNIEDLEKLSETFKVHETTIAEMREKSTPEKIDVYRNYAFIALKMFINKKSREDINFNVIVFDNFIVTTHNKGWQGVANILNFCHVLSGVTSLNPSWVFLSIIIEFSQDMMFNIDEIEKYTDSVKMKHSVKELQSNFFYLHQVFVLKQFIKLKIKILKKFLKTDFPSHHVKKMLKGCIKDFLEIKSLLGEAKRSFERNQDMILGLRDIELAEQSHQMNLIMNRISKITFFFLPIQCVSGLWGMNVTVPWKKEESLFYFWFLTLSGPLLCFLYFFITENMKKFKKNMTNNSQV